MNLLRLLILVAAVWLVWRIVRQVRQQLPRQSPPADLYEPMARCAKCGTHLPAKSLNSAGLCGRCSE
ncbi:PP0621 family protein [Fontimonas sp. SYSU GA230001]|uniref:PP0621 family protein n=1 Tax=Fontimonas sp. SYSU GA230001 TaxID=3142450 RepID=UPI0032B5F256